MKFCPNCGSEIKANAKFCAACGYVLASYMAPGMINQTVPDAGAKNIQNEMTGKESKMVNPFENVGTKEPRYSDYTDYKKADSAETRSARTYTYSDDDGYAVSETNGYAIAALICGILAIPLNFLLFIPGILAIVFGIVGLNRAKTTESGYGFSLAGLILGILASAGYIVLIISAFMLAASL